MGSCSSWCARALVCLDDDWENGIKKTLKYLEELGKEYIFACGTIIPL